MSAFSVLDFGDTLCSRYALPLIDHPFTDFVVIDAQANNEACMVWASNIYIDEDGDGLDAQQEIQLGTSDASPDDSDFDQDGLDVFGEILNGSSIIDEDTDGDGVKDGIEADWGTDPASADTWDWSSDSDGDGLNLELEVEYGLNPYDASDAVFSNELVDVVLLVDNLDPINAPFFYKLDLVGEPSVSSGDLVKHAQKECKLKKGESYDVSLTCANGYDDWYNEGKLYFRAQIIGAGVIHDPEEDDLYGIMGVHIDPYDAHCMHDVFTTYSDYIQHSDEGTVSGAQVHILKTEQEYSEVWMDSGSVLGILLAAGKWKVYPEALEGRKVTVLGYDENTGAEVFNFTETIEFGELRFNAKQSTGPWMPADNGPPGIIWALSFYEGNENNIGYTPPSSLRHRWQENALSQGRKISLSGMPMPDVAQHQEGESDYEPERTYVDALSLDVRHDVTDIFVPVGSDHFALEVRRSLSQECWNTNSFLPEEQPDKPFGPCWSSAICPNLHISRQVGDKTLSFSDHNGSGYTFKEVARNGITNYWAEPSTSQNALSMQGVSYQLEGGEWVLSLPNGTRCFYAAEPAVEFKVVPHVGGGYATSHTYFRIDRVEDRAGNVLHYDFDPSIVPANSIIPSAIRSDSGQEIEIFTESNAGKRIVSVEDPRGTSVEYFYWDDLLCEVVRADGGSTFYEYDSMTEVDEKPLLYPDFFNDLTAVDSLHRVIRSISDANGNTYTFSYTNALRYDYSMVTQMATDSDEEDRLYQIGNPLILTGIERPDGSTVLFEEFGDEGIGSTYSGLKYYLEGKRANFVMDVNGKSWCYLFSDYHTTDPLRGGSAIRLFEYGSLSITGPEQFAETYRFAPLGVTLDNALEPMSIASQTNFSGQVTDFAYGYVGAQCYKPSAQTNALGGVTHTTYTDQCGNQIRSQTDALRRTTAYGFDHLGNRTSVTNFAANGTVLAVSEMKYTDPNFPNFMTKQIVRRIDDADPEWSGDRVTEFVPHEYGKVGMQIVDPGGLNLTTTYDYDDNNNLIYVRDPNGNVTTNGYDALNRLTRIAFFEGENTFKYDKQFWYDLRSNKTWERDENGHYTYFVYDEFNRLVETVRIMDESFNGPRLGTQTYDALSYSENIIVSSGYNPDGTLAWTMDARGLFTTNKYDALQRLTETIVDPEGLALKTACYYDGNSGAITMAPYKFTPTTVTDPRGYKSQTIFDKLNRPVETLAQIASPTAELVTLTTMGYDEVGNMTHSTNWVDSTSNLVTQTLYDDLNRPYLVINPDSTENEIIYTSTGLKWKSIDEMGRVSEVQYDAASRPIRTLSPEIALEGGGTTNAITQTGYDNNGNAIWVKDALGNASTNVYDYRNRVVETIAPAVPDWDNNGVWTHPIVSTVYDNIGNALSITDAEGNTTTNFYDAANRIVETWAPKVSVYGQTAKVRPVTQNFYDAGGNITNTVDANGKSVKMYYDIAGRLESTLDAVGNTISFEYDANGNQRFLTDGNTNTTEFVYDGLNRKIRTKYPDNSQEYAEYDRLGNRTKRTDCNGQSTSYGYDDRGRPYWTWYHTNNSGRMYAYDAAGNLTNVIEYAANWDINTNACVSYSYDALNRITNETSVGVTHTYKYDLNGNRTNAVYGITGRETVWSYDALNRVASIEEGVTNATTYYYTLNGQLRNRHLPNDRWEFRSYDAMGRMVDSWVYGVGSSVHLEYDYDAVGSAVHMHDNGAKETEKDVFWNYDDRYRLIGECIIKTGFSLETFSFVTNTIYGAYYYWDAADNRTSLVRLTNDVLAASITYTNNELNQLSGWHDAVANKHVAYVYDGNGNRVRKTEVMNGISSYVTYGYDVDNRLIHVGPYNLVENGDFEDGDSGFFTDYLLGRDPGHYNIGIDSKMWNGGFPVRTFDHTTGSGLFLMADAASTSLTVWEQTVQVVSGTVYNFGAWICSLAAYQQPLLEFSIADDVVGTAIGVLNSWNPIGATWTAVSTGSITLKIRNLTTGYLGNDSGIDDLSFAENQAVGEHVFAYDYRSRRIYSKTPSAETYFVFDGGLSVQEYAVPPVLQTIDASSIDPYAGSQDQGISLVVYDDRGIRLENNSWKRVALPVNVTKSTTLSFEVYIKRAGEIVAIGLDDDNIFNNPVRLFQLGGSQTGAGLCQDYNGIVEGQWVSMTIPVGEYFTGNMSHLTFLADDDANATSYVVFRNIRIGGAPQASNLQSEYVRGPDLGGGVGGMVYSIRDGKRTYSHSNHRGDVIARTDDEGDLTWYAIYEAYGTRPYEWSDASTGNPDRQKANTKDEEAELGLLNEGMRFRDLETGTFLTRDPIRYGDGPNMYCYVHCNPITSFDPLGLKGLLTSNWNPLTWVRKAGDAIENITDDIPVLGSVGDLAGGVFKTVGQTGELDVSAAATPVIAAGDAAIAIGQDAVNAGEKIREGATWTSEKIRKGAKWTGEKSWQVATATLRFSSRVVGKVNILGNAADNMRDAMVAQSRLDPLGRNESGVSVGFRGDGFKLGGGRFNAANPSFESPLGGIQGGQGEIFGIDYQPGSFADRLVESYAGPHDYLNSGFSYDQYGNIRSKSFLGNIMSQAMNYANVAVATPIVAASVILPTNDNPWF